MQNILDTLGYKARYSSYRLKKANINKYSNDALRKLNDKENL